jgi:HB1, ASXL, restriction endonuclease HTH domain
MSAAKASRQVTRQLENIQIELRELERRREVLGKLLANYQELSDITTIPEISTRSGNNQVRGSVSLRSAVLEVLKNAEGPLKTKEIWKRVAAMGAITHSKNPSSVVDLTLYQLRKSGQPTQKTAPATWQYQEPKGRRKRVAAAG